MSADSLKKVKILVLGDTGVGKTSLVHLLCHGEVLSSPAWTVGCSVDVKIHDYGRSLNSSSSYFLEFWDIGGSPTHGSGRPVFYQQTNGIVLVHDLTNRKSHGNLPKWLAEFHHSQSRGQSTTGASRTTRSLYSFDSRSDMEYDPESYVEQSLPLLVVGTKLDQFPSSKAPPTTSLQGAVCMNVNCTDSRQFAIGSPDAIQFNKFFDKVIERRYHSSSYMVSWYDELEYCTVPLLLYSSSRLDHRVGRDSALLQPLSDGLHFNHLSDSRSLSLSFPPPPLYLTLMLKGHVPNPLT